VRWFHSLGFISVGEDLLENIANSDDIYRFPETILEDACTAFWLGT